MAAQRKKQDDKNLETLRELITINGNRYCFDCHQRGPTYVNMTIGSFICSKCSGMLRGLTPPHRVKSISMASFTPEEIEQIRNEGNDYCRRIWLGLFEGAQPALKDEQSIKDFMSEKYEKQRYFLDPLKHALKTTVVNNSDKSTTNQKSSSDWNNIIVKQPQQQQKPVTKPKVPLSEPKSVITTSTSDSFFDFVTPTVQTSQNIVNPSWQKFPVDFSSAEIYNSSQAINNNNTLPTQTFANFENNNIFNASSDRYAALADLDMALRQQNIQKNLDEQPNANPFYSSNGPVINDNTNKNPFFAGNHNGNVQNYSNPFNANIGHSKNPFL